MIEPEEPLREIFRIILFPLSDIHKLPEVSNANPEGELNVPPLTAIVWPVPPPDPNLIIGAVEPVNWLATKRFPEESNAMWSTPFDPGVVPKVVTFPVDPLIATFLIVLLVPLESAT
jgi:hypothetical protein